MIAIQIEGLLPLKRQLQLLAMPPATRRRLLYRVSQKVIRDSRRRVRTQTDLQGVAFKPGHNPETDTHRHKSGGRKMLKGLARMMRVMRNDSFSATIGFPGIAGNIAAKHQFGSEETVTAEQLKTKQRDKGKEYYDNPATKKQAKALRDLGYRPRGGNKRPSYKALIEHMSIGQAGAIIKSMRKKRGYSPKQSWQTKLPARSFLGAAPQDVTDYINTVFETIMQGLNHGTR